MDFHPAASLFPLMEGDEFDQLVRDVADNGLREAILTFEGQIIDGRNRYRACLRAGVDPRFEAWDGAGSLIAFVLSLNLHRRHLTASQRAVIALEALPMLEAEARERQRTAGLRYGEGHPREVTPLVVEAPVEPTAVGRAANLVGVGHTFVQEAKRIARHEPELIERIRSGNLSVKAAGKLLGPTARESAETYSPAARPRLRVRPNITEQLVADYNAAWAELRPTVSGASAEFERLQSRLIQRVISLQDDLSARQKRDRAGVR